MIDQSLWKTAVALQEYLQGTGHPFCFIGGIVVQRWGQPRMTGDVDATILTRFGGEAELAEEILRRYQSRIESPLQFAIQSRILLLQDIRNNRIDLSIGGLDFEYRIVERSSMWGIPGGGYIRTCGAEDLVVLKAFAARPQDWIDVEQVIIRQGEKLDRELIHRELAPLAELKEEPEILAQLEHLHQKHLPSH
ncbi:nucleotidyltransferase [Planctomycetaceae bacterium SH139]